MQNYYFITVKRVGKQMPTLKHYTIWLNRFHNWHNPEFYQIVDQAYEYGKFNRLHLHMLVLGPANKDFSNLYNMFKSNWHVDVQCVKDEKDIPTILNYLLKEKEPDYKVQLEYPFI